MSHADQSGTLGLVEQPTEGPVALATSRVSKNPVWGIQQPVVVTMAWTGRTKHEEAATFLIAI